jgi:hypothetical protein
MLYESYCTQCVCVYCNYVFFLHIASLVFRRRMEKNDNHIIKVISLCLNKFSLTTHL